jgi:hypothetical protein
MTWHPGEIYKAWDKIHHALYEVMKHLPHETSNSWPSVRLIQSFGTRRRGRLTGWVTARRFRIGAGSLVPARSAFDVTLDDSRAALVEGAKLARAKGQLVAWDNSECEYSIALYHEQTHQPRAAKPLGTGSAVVVTAS